MMQLGFVSAILSDLSLEEAARLIVLGVILLVLLSIYGRERGLRQ